VRNFIAVLVNKIYIGQGNMMECFSAVCGQLSCWVDKCPAINELFNQLMHSDMS